MPDEYVHIQTYATCNERTYAIVASHYRLVLEQLGCTDTQVLNWLDTVRWPTSDDDGLGDIYAAPFTLAPAQDEGSSATLESAGIEISLYVDAAIPSMAETSLLGGF